MTRILTIGASAVVSIVLAFLIVTFTGVEDLFGPAPDRQIEVETPPERQPARSAQAETPPPSQDLSPGPLATTALTDAQTRVIDEVLSGSELFQAIEQVFPAEFQTLRQEMEAAAPAGAAAIQSAAARGVAQLQSQNAPLLQTASSSALRNLVAENIRTHEVVQERAGDQVCAAFGLNGSAALGPFANDDAIVAQLERQKALLFRTMATGRGPTSRAPVNDSDWASVIRFSELSNENQNLVRIYGTQNAENPRYCAAVLWFMNRLLDAEGEAADRARAAFALQLAGS